MDLLSESKAANLVEAGRGRVNRSRLALLGELGIHGRKLKQTLKTPGVF